jgi:hypothetical protein
MKELLNQNVRVMKRGMDASTRQKIRAAMAQLLGLLALMAIVLFLFAIIAFAFFGHYSML